jgi:hypothetical protein
MDKYNPRDHFDISPQQYHNGLDKLWKALGLTAVQKRDVFTIVSEELTTLRKRLAEAEGELDALAELTKSYVIFKPSIGSDELWRVLGEIFNRIQAFLSHTTNPEENKP